MDLLCEQCGRPVAECTACADCGLPMHEGCFAASQYCQVKHHQLASYLEERTIPLANRNL